MALWPYFATLCARYIKIIPMKKTILVFASTYLPGVRAGGPIRTLSNLIRTFSDEFDMRLVTSDRDLGSDLPYENIATNRWISGDHGSLFYSDLSYRLKNPFWRRLIREVNPDVVYLNSLFDPVFTLSPIIGCASLGMSPGRILLAPRGELAQSALGLKAHKKRPVLAIMKRWKYFHRLTWHATGPHEVTDIRNMFGSSIDIKLASNISADTPERQTAFEGIREGTSLKVVFLGRVARMKNLHFALNVLCHRDLSIEFDIWGPIEDVEYWKECEAISNRLPPSVTMSYRGELARDEVVGRLRQYDLLFLPTLGENFGHVIAESLSAGTPVLISDRTPWRGLERAGAGWDLSLEEPDRFSAALQAYAGLSMTEREVRRQAARAYFSEIQRSNDAVSATRQMLEAIALRS